MLSGTDTLWWLWVSFFREHFAAFVFIDHIVSFMLAPTRRMLPPGTHLIYTQPGEAFGSQKSRRCLTRTRVR